MSRLAEIIEVKRQEVAAAKAMRSLEDVRSRAIDAEPTREFARALREAARPVALIAEVKKASPSEGLIRPDFDVADIARQYERAGAHCLSVLTDSPFFQGAPENLQIAREATSLPALRKDFTIDLYQVYEARAIGADAILLIVACLELAQLIEYREAAEELRMDALVEVHTMAEAEVALESGAGLIGVNNRDLSTFRTDLATSEAILPMLEGRLAVSESAITTVEDVLRVQSAGARAVLIGTTFCRAANIEAKVREVMGW